MQANTVVPPRGKHTFHLMIAPFADGQADLGRGDDFEHRRFGQIFFIMQLNAFREVLVSSDTGDSSVTR